MVRGTPHGRRRGDERRRRSRRSGWRRRSHLDDQRNPGDAGRGITGAVGCADTGDDGRCAGFDLPGCVAGTDVAFDARIHSARPHPGQMLVAKHLRTMLEGSALRERHRDCKRVQDAYSMRCIPQVHGAVLDVLDYARQVFEIEMNSAVDNPLVFVKAPAAEARRSREILRRRGDLRGKLPRTADRVRSGLYGDFNFVDCRHQRARIERMVNPSLSEGLPAFLAAGRAELGLHDAAGDGCGAGEREQGAGTSGIGRFDHDERKQGRLRIDGMTAALKLKRVIQNVRYVLAIEALAAAQAVDLVAPLKPGKRAQQALKEIRAVVTYGGAGPVSGTDIAKVADVIRAGKLAAVLR